MDKTLVPFQPVASAAEIAQLRARLRATRWPDAPADVGWSAGVDLEYLRDLVGYWAEDFDWARIEGERARQPRFRVDLDGLGVHVIHARGVGGTPPLALLLCHGWPDSAWRYEKVIPLLTDPAAHGADPADAFDIVVADMPGFGYSTRPPSPLNSRDVAGLWAGLMSKLGYERFGAAGGDVGSHVARFLALDHSERVVAVHRTDAGLPVYAGDPSDLSAAERGWMSEAMAWGASEGAYAAIHRTKPQTLAVGLTDSPAGLAAWIVEKMRSWSDCGGDIERRFTRDEILTNISGYWFTGTIGSAIAMYRANAAMPAAQHARRVATPSGFAIFAGDILPPPDEWLKRVANTVRITRPPRGGHFAAFEEPGLYAADLREFFRPYR